MNLLKSSGLTFIATAIRLSVAFVINKMVSVFVGPAGLAILGQFQNLLQISLVCSTGAINTGVVKYISENKSDVIKKRKIIETSIVISMLASLFCAIFLYVFSLDIAIYIFNKDEYEYVIKTLSFTIFFFSLNQLVISILNGEREILLLTKVNILQSIVSLLLSITLIKLYSIEGALLALSVNQSLVFFLIVSVAYKRIIKHFNILKLSCDKEVLLQLVKFSMMAITTAIVSPVVLIWIRGYITDTISEDYAGYWQAIYFFSSTYLMLITTSLSTYFLPKLSSCKLNKEINDEIKNGLKLVLPGLIITSIFIYLLKDLIIVTLFSEDFMEISGMFKYQLFGDVFKIISWFFSYLMLAKSITKVYIFCEIFFSITLCMLMKVFIDCSGLIGASMAYTVNYFIYMIATIYLTKEYWKRNV
ncbi:O-antigen translocase [Photobacterium sanguinicancri]|uniref:O-antigen translocase n=1 Tax=Photobacterium sanguinicancri TaxID=875932 RepID=UPI000788E329|nr:O-antigen translocase [Photobacterium sanguinicancri]KXI22129.1 hypothetical protein AS132_15510 [Photobacterium sanguinicancri]